MATTADKAGKMASTAAAQSLPQQGSVPAAAVSRPSPIPVTVDAAKVASTPIPADRISPVTATYNPATPMPAIATATAVDAVANRQNPEPQQPQLTQKQTLLQQYMDRIDPAANAQQKDQLRQDADLQRRSDEANRLQSQLKATQKSYRDQIEGIVTQGKGVPQAITQRQAQDLRRKADNHLADLAIQAEFALNNYQGAEQILQARIADLDTDFDNQIKAYQIASDFLTNDLSDSEKQQIEFQQQDLMAQKTFERNKLMAEFEQKLQQSDPLYQAQVANAYDQIRSRREADALATTTTVGGGKPLSGEAAKIVGIANTLVPELEQLKQRFSQDFKGTVLKIKTGTDPELTKLVSNAADKVGRLRSGGAVNPDEEERFRNQIVSTADYFFGNSEKTAKAIDGVIREAQTVLNGVSGGIDGALATPNQSADSALDDDSAYELYLKAATGK